MIRLAISVEGQTEEEFIKRVLSPHLRESGVEPTPILLGRARGRSVGGGDVRIGRLSTEIASLLWTNDAVSSLVDFYGFAGKEERTIDELERDLSESVREEASNRWDERKVIPYVQKHEFEGLLFSDVSAFGDVIVDASERSITQLHVVRDRFPTPEDINDNPHTAPSKRISTVIPGYRKSLHGPVVAAETGLTVIRRECPRFDKWIRRLESLGTVLL